MHEGDMAATAVHDIPPPPGHFEKNTPLLLARIQARLFRDVVAVIDDDRYLREQQELRLTHGDGAQRSAPEGQRGRPLPLGKRKVEARLEGDDGADIPVLDSRAPAHPAALGMGDENARPDLAE